MNRSLTRIALSCMLAVALLFAISTVKAEAGGWAGCEILKVDVKEDGVTSHRMRIEKSGTGVATWVYFTSNPVLATAMTAMASRQLVDVIWDDATKDVVQVYLLADTY